LIVTNLKPYPLLLEPALHAKVWGGRKLADVMGKTLPSADPYGESWELHDSCVVANGAYAGKTLGEMVEIYGAELIGAGNDPADGLPLLVKLLDAADWLSIQVHPNDAQAAELEGQPRGKTEAWIILAAEPTAKLVIGMEPGTDREEMAQAIRDNHLEDYIVAADVKAGDVFYIPAGTVHAIGPGIVLYEIQQSSDTTYRLYDWGRMGLDGKPRQLHIEKGVQVSNLASVPQVTHPARDSSPVVTMVQGEFFTTTLYRLQRDSRSIQTNGNFHALTCIDGAIVVEANGVSVAMTTGQTVMIPAACAVYTLSGVGQVLRSSQTG
jgi:mannose-6-phosphate isomerase